MKYRVRAEVTVTVYKVVEADSKEEAEELVLPDNFQCMGSQESGAWAFDGMHEDPVFESVEDVDS